MSILFRVPCLRLLLLFLALAWSQSVAAQHGEHGHAHDGFLLFSTGLRALGSPETALYTLDLKTGRRTMWPLQLHATKFGIPEWDWGLTYDANREFLWGNCHIGNDYGVMGFNPWTGASYFISAVQGFGIAYSHEADLHFRIVLHPIGNPPTDWYPVLTTFNPLVGDEQELFRIGLPQDNLHVGASIDFSFFTNMARSLSFHPRETVLYAGYLNAGNPGIVADMNFQTEAADQTIGRNPEYSKAFAVHPTSEQFYFLGAYGPYDWSFLIGPHGFIGFCGGDQLGLTFAPQLPGRED
jgi:hypothetical protein